MNQPASAPELSSLKGEVSHAEPDRLGRLVARRSAEVRATVPDLELSSDADAGAALVLARDRDVPLTAVLVRACALALRETPVANAAYRDGRFELYSRINVGVTIHSDGAQITPALLDADAKSLTQLAAELDQLHDRAQSGELTPPELAGTTFTFADMGPFGVHRYSPLVTAPQAAALAAGAVRDAPLLRDGSVVAGSVLTLTLACDHRILFGAQAAAFLARVVAQVESPEP
ncbi:MAG: 2-oxo acid dehydrogenase subunit E2 [Solirubrobacteraceae bacterium]